jgi:hypothetical protein
MLLEKDVFYHAGNCPHRDEKGFCLALLEEAGYYCGGYFCARTPENPCCFTTIEKESEKA